MLGHIFRPVETSGPPRWYTSEVVISLVYHRGGNPTDQCRLLRPRRQVEQHPDLREEDPNHART